eukprot:jgi/Hompol1/385/HPOL_005305-RA
MNRTDEAEGTVAIGGISTELSHSAVGDNDEDEGFDEQHQPTLPAKVFLGWSEEQRAELAMQLLLSVSSAARAGFAARLAPLLQRDFVSQLPAELAVAVLSFTDARTLGRAAQVCRRWRAIATENAVWKALYFARGWTVNEPFLDSLLSGSVLASAVTPTLSSTSSLHTPHTSIPNPLFHSNAAPLPILQTTATEPVSPSTADLRLRPQNLSAPLSIPTPMTDMYTPDSSNTLGISGTDSWNIASNAHARVSRSNSLPFEDETVEMGDLHSPVLHQLAISTGSAMLSSPPDPSCLPNLDDPMHRSGHLRHQSVSCLNMKLPQSPLSAVATSERYVHLDWKHIYHQRWILESNWRDGNYVARNFAGHEEAIYCLQFDEDKIISGSRDDSIKIWDMKTGACRNTLYGHAASVLCLQYNDRILVSGSSDANIIVWDLATGSIIRRLTGHLESILNLQFDESVIVSCSKDKTIKVWQTNTGVLERTLKGHRAAINAVQYNSGLIVSASGDRTIKVWDINNGALLRTLQGHSRGIACVQFDGNIIVSGSSDKTIKIWDVHTGHLLNTLTGHTDLVRTLQFDSQRILSGSYDQSIKVWDIRSGTLLRELNGGHTSRVFKLQFNETKVVSCSQDQQIVVWDFSQGIDSRYFATP